MAIKDTCSVGERRGVEFSHCGAWGKGDSQGHVLDEEGPNGILDPRVPPNNSAPGGGIPDHPLRPPSLSDWAEICSARSAQCSTT